MLNFLFRVLLLVVVAAVPALAEPPVQAPAATAADIDKMQVALDEIEKSLERPNIKDDALQDLRKRLDPIASAGRAAVEALAPRHAAIKARLEQLGPKPDEKRQDDAAPAEDAAVAAERADQQKALGEAEDLTKRARLVALRAEQAASAITARRRALFASSLFERVTSLANPELLSDVWREIPRHGRAVVAAFREWFDGVNGRLDEWRFPEFWGSIALVLAACVGVTWAARFVLSRSEKAAAPSRLQKCLAAWWVALSIILPAIAAVMAIAFVFSAFGLNNARLESFMRTAGEGIVRIAVVAGVTRGLFAPTRPDWRLLSRSDAESTRAVTLAIGVATIVSVTRLLESLNDIVGASLAFSVATRGVHALVVVFTLWVGLWHLDGKASDEIEPGPRLHPERDWFGLFRLAVWPVTLAIVVSVLVGYVTFGNFLVDQLVWVGVILCVLYLSTVLVEEVTAAIPSSPFGVNLRRKLGFAENGFVLLAIVVSGVVRLALYAAAALLIVAPWGLQSSDVSFDVAAAFFGFRVGDIQVSPAHVLVAVAIFALVYALAHTALRWLDKSLLPHTGLDLGLRNSIRTSLDYLGFIVAAGLALGYLGLGIEKLAIVAGALSVGIGFGLQSIVNNFVSGLILLWERAVRVGDWIIVGNDQGFVRRINVRSTEIETFDRSQVIIPNSSLVTGVVKNLVRNDRTGRIVVPVTVAGSADPEKVREVLFAIAKAHELVLKFPAPQILFTSLSASALTFELVAFVTDVETSVRVRSDLHFEIFKRFKEEKFMVAPGPDPTKVEIAGLDDLAARLGPKVEARPEAPPVTSERVTKGLPRRHDGC